MALDVKVKIELSKTVGSTGFGIPFLVGFEGDKAIPYTECYSLADVIALAGEDAYVSKAAQVLFAQTNRPAKIAVAQVAEGTELVTAVTSAMSKNWRQCVPCGKGIGAGELVAIADKIETTMDKMLFIGFTAEEFATAKTSFANKKYDRTVIFVANSDYANAALVGETAGRPAGSFTYKNMVLKGVTPSDLTDAEITTLHTAGAIGYVTKAGDNVTTEGIALSGKYIDLTDSIDYVIQNIEYRVQKVLNNSAKVPYDDRGIALLESATLSALQDAAVNGIIAQKEDGTYDYSVAFGARSVTTEADRASRVYNYGTFHFSLAGAIHDCTVYGEVTA